MANLIGSKSIPPGIRFHPTDEELFMYYLKRKILGKSLRPEMIAELNIYHFAPWDLPSQSCLKTRDLNWYFFCPRSRKYPHGGRPNRTTECGYWKPTGNDRTVEYNHRCIGKIKTLIFHLGKAPKGERTDWVMHEYRLEDSVLADKGVSLDSYVICKVYKKSGFGPRNGENYGAPFVEEEWESDDESDVEKADSQEQKDCRTTDKAMSVGPDLTTVTDLTMVTEPASGGGENAAWAPPCSRQVSLGGDMAVCGTVPPLASVVNEEDELDRLLAMFADNDAPNNVSDDIFGGLEDLGGCLSPKVGPTWSEFVGGGGDEFFIELDDLN